MSFVTSNPVKYSCFFARDFVCVCDVLISSISHYLSCSMMSKYFEWGQDTKLSCCKHQRETFFFLLQCEKTDTFVTAGNIYQRRVRKTVREDSLENVQWIDAVADYKMCRNTAVSMVHDDDCLLLSVIFHLNTLVFVSGYLSW